MRPLIEATLAERRSSEKLRALISALTEAVMQTEVAKKATGRVILRELPKTHWGRRRRDPGRARGQAAEK